MRSTTIRNASAISAEKLGLGDDDRNTGIRVATPPTAAPKPPAEPQTYEYEFMRPTFEQSAINPEDYGIVPEAGWVYLPIHTVDGETSLLIGGDPVATYQNLFKAEIVKTPVQVRNTVWIRIRQETKDAYVKWMGESSRAKLKGMPSATGLDASEVKRGGSVSITLGANADA